MSAGESQRAPARALADSSSAERSNTASIHQTGSALKYRRVLLALIERPHLDRFTAERDPAIRDHVLPSTVSELQRRGVRIERRIVAVPGYQGGTARIAEYWLEPTARDAALRILASRP